VVTSPSARALNPLNNYVACIPHLGMVHALDAFPKR
jgi:hypothetical protein